MNLPLTITEPNTYYELSVQKIETLLRDGRIPKTPMQKLERLLVRLYQIDDKIGQYFWVGITSTTTGIGLGNATESMLKPKNYPISLAYARNAAEVRSMFKSLESLCYLEFKEKNGFVFTPKGFERAEQLLSTNIDSKTVFIAMGFRDDLLDACEEAIKPACIACGFKGILITDKPHNNGISDEIMVEIKRSKFVIVDFTYNNNGAYFEAGYAQGLGRPVIRCCKKEWFEEKDSNGNRINILHFDTQHYNTIVWESYEHLYKELKNNIRANIDGAVLNDKEPL